MIQINLLPENLKESTGPSSIGVIVLILTGVLLNLVIMGAFGWLHFVIFPDLQNTEKQLIVRLEALKRKTKDYDSLKKEKQSLEKKTKLVRKLIDERILWSNRLQDIAIFTNDRRVWFSDFKVKEEKPKRQRRGKKKPPPKSYYKIILEGHSASRDLNIPNDFRKDVVLTDWWKEHFQEGGINDPAYEIKPLPSEFYQEEFYHSFVLELSMSPTGVQEDKKKKAKKKGS